MRFFSWAHPARKPTRILSVRIIGKVAVEICRCLLLFFDSRKRFGHRGISIPAPALPDIDEVQIDCRGRGPEQHRLRPLLDPEQHQAILVFVDDRPCLGQ